MFSEGGKTELPLIWLFLEIKQDLDIVQHGKRIGAASHTSMFCS
jgi:hypothetical protein